MPIGKVPRPAQFFTNKFKAGNKNVMPVCYGRLAGTVVRVRASEWGQELT